MDRKLMVLAALLVLTLADDGTTSAKTGHMKPFGEQGSGELLPVDEVEGFLKPKTFVTEYVDKNKPLVMRGAAKVSDAWKKWTDEYFVQNAPQSFEGEVQYEIGKKETRSGKGGEMNMKEFVEKYKTRDIYLVTDIADWMKKDLTIPGPLQCKDFQEKLLDTTVMWFSSGGTSSVVHRDDFENINCIYRGSKTLIFVNYTKYEHLADQILPSGGYNGLIDVDKIDLEKHPVFSQLEYHRAEMHPGDCLYIPYNWVHQVRSSSGSNLAVNIWWNQAAPGTVDFATCNDAIDKALTYDKVNWLSTEVVQNAVEDVEDFRRLMKANLKIKSMDLEMFTKYLVEGCNVLTKDAKVMKAVETIFEVMDKNANRKLEIDDMKIKPDKLELSKLVNAANIVDKTLFENMKKTPTSCQGTFSFKSNAPNPVEPPPNDDEIEKSEVPASEPTDDDILMEDLDLDLPHDEL